MAKLSSHTNRRSLPLSDNGNDDDSPWGQIGDDGAPDMSGDSNDTPITADSEPQFNIPFWPDDSWDCQDWVTWHKKNVEKYGQQKANEKFITQWSKQGLWDSNFSFCKYYDHFRSYFADQGINVNSFTSQIINNAKDTAVNVSEGAKGISAGVGDLNLNKVLWILGIAGAGYVFYPTLQDKVQEWID